MQAEARNGYAVTLIAMLGMILLLGACRGGEAPPLAPAPAVSVPASQPAAVPARKIADNGGRCAWSPAGDDRIAFDRKNPRDGYYDVWLMNADGSNQICLTEPPPAGMPSRHIGNPSWHPSGRYIVVNAEQQDNPLVGRAAMEPYCEPGIGRNNELWLLAADGSRAWRLWQNPTPPSLFAPQPALYNARFSHDGTKLAWTHSPSGAAGAWGEYVIRVADFSPGRGRAVTSTKCMVGRPMTGALTFPATGAASMNTIRTSAFWTSRPER